MMTQNIVVSDKRMSTYEYDYRNMLDMLDPSERDQHMEGAHAADIELRSVEVKGLTYVQMGRGRDDCDDAYGCFRLLRSTLRDILRVAYASDVKLRQSSLHKMCLIANIGNAVVLEDDSLYCSISVVWTSDARARNGWLTITHCILREQIDMVWKLEAVNIVDSIIESGISQIIDCGDAYIRGTEWIEGGINVQKTKSVTLSDITADTVHIRDCLIVEVINSKIKCMDIHDCELVELVGSETAIEKLTTERVARTIGAERAGKGACFPCIQFR